MFYLHGICLPSLVHNYMYGTELVVFFQYGM
uniref:Uncharacterized protein n=1 Tax=Arundo donax TaxID=35708 RepID=A0A0A9A2F9_ARUDO